MYEKESSELFVGSGYGRKQRSGCSGIFFTPEKVQAEENDTKAEKKILR